jgi:hypothetical protein
MAAGGWREFVAGETLDENEINDFLMQGILVFAGTAARGSALPSPVEGQFSFRTDDDLLEFYDGSSWINYTTGFDIDYLVIGGGGAGGAGVSRACGGGGAGGYRCNVSGELSGGSAVAERALRVGAGTYTLTVGAGGAAPTRSSVGGDSGGVGGNSIFGPVVSVGGGGGAGVSSGRAKVTGGSGGGGGATVGGADPLIDEGGLGILGLGRNGGDGVGSASESNQSSGGGGGAQDVGVTATTSTQAAGGDGISSSITGSAVTRAGGGGGYRRDASGGSGGAGGGGAGTWGSATGNSGTVNRGSGGGGSGSNSTVTSGSGGSGVVIFRVPLATNVTFSDGVEETSATVGGQTRYTVTAAGPTDTVTIG